MTKFRSAVLISALALAGSVAFATAAAACDRDCGCVDGNRHHRHHAMAPGSHHMHAMRHQRFEHRRFSGEEHERRVVIMRFRHDTDGPHERFDAWHGSHAHHFAMRGGEGEGCGHRMHRGGWEHHAWGDRDGERMAMSEWHERRHHGRHDHDGDEDHHHHRGFDPYRDQWDSRGGDSNND